MPVLHQARICAFVRQYVAAAVPQLMRVDMVELGALAGLANQVVKVLAAHPPSLAAQEQPGLLVRPGGQVQLQRLDLVRSQRLLR
jgi:hypothetical protein